MLSAAMAIRMHDWLLLPHNTARPPAQPSIAASVGKISAGSGSSDSPRSHTKMSLAPNTTSSSTGPSAVGVATSMIASSPGLPNATMKTSLDAGGFSNRSQVSAAPPFASMYCSPNVYGTLRASTRAAGTSSIAPRSSGSSCTTPFSAIHWFCTELARPSATACRASSGS